MILNDMKVKVKGKFFKEVSIEDDGNNITYVFPDTEEFLSILRRRINKDLTLD
jgi:hypothetical protein